MNWIAVTDQPAPQDRLILVTSGFAWRHEDYYSKNTDETFRTWKTRGMVVGIVWNAGSKNWQTGGGDSFHNEFTHWCDFNNPIADGSVRLKPQPPCGVLSQKFEGRKDRATLLHNLMKENAELSNRSMWANPDTNPGRSVEVYETNATLAVAAKGRIDALLLVLETSTYSDDEPL